MSSLGRVKFNQFFQDRSGRVLQAIDRTKRRTYSQAGANVRQTARWSIRPRKSVSKPGAPPSSHSGGLRRSIFFGYDRLRDSVVVGPRADYGPSRISTSTRPELIEFGGRAKDADTKRTLQYRARPFMGPALDKEAPSFPDLWANAVRG